MSPIGRASWRCFPAVSAGWRRRWPPLTGCCSRRSVNAPIATNLVCPSAGFEVKMGSFDSQLVALDALTGEILWECRPPRRFVRRCARWWATSCSRRCSPVRSWRSTGRRAIRSGRSTRSEGGSTGGPQSQVTRSSSPSGSVPKLGCSPCDFGDSPQPVQSKPVQSNSGCRPSTVPRSRRPRHTCDSHDTGRDR